MPPKKLEKSQDHEFLLSPINDPLQTPISITGIGKHSIGRGNLIVRDARVSRDHCGFEIKIDEKTCSQIVEIFRTGLNPLYVHRGEHIISIDEPFLLEEGDQISLLSALAENPHKFLFTTKLSSKRKLEVKNETKSKNIVIDLVDEKEEESMKKKRKIEIHLVEDDFEQIEKKDATHSEKVSPSEREKADHELALKFQPKECSLCLEELDFDFFQSLQCGHEFCRDCLYEYLKMKISEKAIPIPCPYNGCSSNVSESDLHLLIEPKLMEKYENFMLSNFIETNANDFSCCPTPNCPYLFYYEQGDFDFKCPKCHKRYCLNCKVDYHVNSTCKKYQKWCVDNGQADDLFTDFVRGNKLKKCFRCKKFVQKVSGCNHITCTCGAQFCYVCGEKFPCNNRKCASHAGDEDESGSDLEDESSESYY